MIADHVLPDTVALPGEKQPDPLRVEPMTLLEVAPDYPHTVAALPLSTERVTTVP